MSTRPLGNFDSPLGFIQKDTGVGYGFCARPICGQTLLFWGATPPRPPFNTMSSVHIMQKVFLCILGCGKCGKTRIKTKRKISIVRKSMCYTQIGRAQKSYPTRSCKSYCSTLRFWFLAYCCVISMICHLSEQGWSSYEIIIRGQVLSANEFV